MNARTLAVDLAGLAPDERDALLRDLPAEKRTALTALVEEVNRLSALPEQSFDAHWAAAHNDWADREPTNFGAAARQVMAFDIGALSDSQLRVLLANEPHALQQRLLTAIRAGSFRHFPPVLQKSITAHLTDVWDRNGAHAAPARKPRPWWRQWLTRFKP
jgi:hypothetical protein